MPDRVVRAVQQVVQREALPGMALRKTRLQPLHRARDLRSNRLFHLSVGLDQTAFGLLQKAGLLLDHHHAGIGRDHHEVDLAIDAVALLQPRPVHAVEDGIAGRQRLLQIGEGFKLALCRAGGGEFAPAAGMNGCHE